MSNLNLKKLSLRDYRCFVSLDIEFHPQLTVLVASNGAGKTSILDAIAVAFGPYVGAFSEGKGKGKHFTASDIRLSQVRETETNEMEHAPLGVRMKATGVIPGSLINTIWKRGLSSPIGARTTIKYAKQLIDYGKRVQQAVRTPGSNITLPLLAYYGTGRLWQQKKQTVNKKLSHTSRTHAYSDCLDSASGYKSFLPWFRYWYTNSQSERIKALETGKHYQSTEFDDYIAAVSRAVDMCLEPVGWHSLTYSLSREALVARHKNHGELPVELLSDGIRNMIGVVADIAFRATKLNPQFGAHAPVETPGIVLIDEVDMHLHPEWQQIILQTLTKAFPKLQFIVTTHSPQVLSTIRRENIRVISQSPDGQTVAIPPLSMTYGEPSGDVMHSVMHVDPQPPIVEKEALQQLTNWVDQGEFDKKKARLLMQQLIHKLGEHHPQLQRLQRSIVRQQALLG